MNINKIRNELEKIYKEIKSWNGTKGSFTESLITNRELILIKQQILQQLEDIELLKNKNKKSFYVALYKIVNNYI